MSSDKDKPDYKSPAYEAHEPDWELVDVLVEGTKALRLHADSSKLDLLPQFPAEHEDVYQDRVKVATLYPAYKDTLDGMIGTVFRKPPTLGKDVPKSIADAWENIDLGGTHWTVFAAQFLRDCLHYGTGAILVDAPATKATDRQTEQANGVRPYVVRYDADDIYSWRYVVINGKRTLQQIVLHEETCVPDGMFAEKEVERFRIWTLPVDIASGRPQIIGKAQWQLFEKQEKKEKEGGAKTEFILIGEGISAQDEIPVVVYGDLDEACPVLLDLAYLNICLAQKRSDFDSSLHIVGVPQPYAIGRSKEATSVAWGKSTLIDLEDGGALGYAEPTGAGLEMMRTDMNDIKAEMRDMGLALALEGSADVAQTATEQFFQAGKRSSRLSQIVQSVHDCLEECLYFHAAYYGEKSGGSITMGAGADELILSVEELRVLSDMADRDQLDIKTVWAMMLKAGKLPDDFDIELQYAERQKRQENILASDQAARQSTPMVGQAA